jgi:hypothetical protein
MNAMDYMKSFLQRVQADAIGLARLFKTSVIVVCGWALIEAPLELIGSINSTSLLALVTSKMLMCVIGAAAIANLRFARQVFAFICGASVLAIAPALPLEYTRCIPIALFSTVECISKAACVASLAVAAMTRDGVGERLSVLDRTADEET